MKTNFKNSLSLILAGVILLAINAWAIDPSKEASNTLDVKLERVENTMRFKLNVANNLKKKKLSIIIKNEFNQEVMKEAIDDKSEIERIYDFSSMEPGNYVVEVWRGKEKITNAFSNYTLKDGKLLFNVVFVSNKPEKIYSILMYNQAKDNVILKLLNNNGETVFFQIIKNEETYGKNYNFSQLKTGNYTLEVSRGDKKFTKFITIE